MSVAPLIMGGPWKPIVHLYYFQINPVEDGWTSITFLVCCPKTKASAFRDNVTIFWHGRQKILGACLWLSKLVPNKRGEQFLVQLFNDQRLFFFTMCNNWVFTPWFNHTMAQFHSPLVSALFFLSEEKGQSPNMTWSVHI